MTCLQCGTAMRTTRETFNYKASGLPGVTLKDVKVSRCRECGDFEVSIPRLEQLHRALAMLLIEKETSFTGGEVAYLRKFLGWSGADFARHIGVAAETVSRWENSKEPMGAPADRALRLMVATREPVREYPLKRLLEIRKMKPRPLRVGLRASTRNWALATAVMRRLPAAVAEHRRQLALDRGGGQRK